MRPGEVDSKFGVDLADVAKEKKLAANDVSAWRKLCIDELKRLIQKHSFLLTINKRKRHVPSESERNISNSSNEGGGKTKIPRI